MDLVPGPDLRALACGLQQEADRLHTLAGALEERAAAVAWQGCAATAMREVVGVRVASVRRSAALLGEAGAALQHHAAVVEHRLGLLGEAVHVVRGLV